METGIELENFIVGDVFRHRAENNGGGPCLFLENDFKSWIIEPNLEKVISTDIDIGKLKEYFSPSYMNDFLLQKNTFNPGFIEFDTFSFLIYLLIFKPEIGKQILGYTLQKDKLYMLHIMVDGKKFSFCMSWCHRVNGNYKEWILSSFKFGTEDWYHHRGNIFLYF